VNHTYTTAAATGTTYTVNLHVVDGVGHSADKTLTVKAYRPLTASIAASVTSGTTPLAVNFTSTVAGGDGAYTYLWNFGDGTTGNTANPAKTYTTGGNFSVTLTVTDGASHVIISNTINMTTWSPMTVASSATPTVIIVGQSITFTALAQGGDGVYTYTWTFGDATTGTGATINHMYAVGPSPNFTYTAHVTVTDTSGHSVTGANIVVTVKPVPPTITAAQKLVPPQVESWRIRLLGTNFQAGCVATINGTAVTTTFKNSGQIILKNCKSLCPKNVPVTIVVTNPNGGVSAPFTFVNTQTP
jgi:PKD repeat protein